MAKALAILSGGFAKIGAIYGRDRVKFCLKPGVQIGAVEIIAGLEVDPHLRTGPEKASETFRGVGGDAGLFPDQPFDPRAGHPEGFGELAGAHLKRGEEILPQDFAGVDRGRCSQSHVGSSVIIHDFDVFGVGVTNVVVPAALASMASGAEFFAATVLLDFASLQITGVTNPVRSVFP